LIDALTPAERDGLAARLAEARETLERLVRNLQTVDAELESLTVERNQYRLVHDVCAALDALGESGGAELFWGSSAGLAAGADHLRNARSRVDAFQRRISEIEDRRQTLIKEIEQQGIHTGLLEEDILDAEDAEEARKAEWIIERDDVALPAHALAMTWARDSEDDKRFRKTLASTLAICLALALIFPHIALPLVTMQDEAVKVPERVVRMMMQSRPLPPARPHVEVPKPPPPPERVVEQKPPEKVAPRQSVEPVPEQQIAEKAPSTPKGILAFREKFESLKDTQVDTRLGLNARINTSDENASGRPQRAMLTTNAPGSSGGINLASLSRGLGGDRGNGTSGSMAGVLVTRAQSSIGGGGGSDRPLARGAYASRTDEEIQIVFDRYKAALYRLYNRELRKDPTLRGQLVLRLTIEPDGSVSMCALQASDMNAPDLAAQVVERVRAIDFGAKENIQALTIVYPIDFLPAA
jgi:hypothetical protein